MRPAVMSSEVYLQTYSSLELRSKDSPVDSQLFRNVCERRFKAFRIGVVEKDIGAVRGCPPRSSTPRRDVARSPGHLVRVHRRDDEDLGPLGLSPPSHAVERTSPTLLVVQNGSKRPQGLSSPVSQQDDGLARALVDPGRGGLPGGDRGPTHPSSRA